MDYILLNSLLGIVIMFFSTINFFKLEKKIIQITYLSVGLMLFVSGYNFFDAQLFPELANTLHFTFNHFEWLFLFCMDVCFIIFCILNFHGIIDLQRPLHEQIALMFFIKTGCAILLSFNNLLVLFIGLEMVSIPLYILTGINKQQLKGNEAALKYLLLGALSTCLFLMGITLIYGSTGTFYLPDFVNLLSYSNTWFQVGLIFVLISMSFKVSAAPFHFWTPDIYEGAPTVYTAFMASIVKSFFILALLRLFIFDWGIMKQQINFQLSIIIACTLIIGNFTAIYQQGLKRFMAYSSISQVGFMLLAIWGSKYFANEGLFLYAISYTIASISIFYIINKSSNGAIENLKGLSKENPLIAFCLTIYLLSLAGIPITAGFIAKYYMLISALKNNINIFLIVIIIICATISVFYYLRLIQNVYFKERTLDGQFLNNSISNKMSFILILNAGIIIILGMKPSWLLNWLNY